MVIFGLLVPNIDNAAHFGGLATGFVVARLAGLPRPNEQTEKFWRIASYVCLLLTAVCFLKMYLSFASPES
jgi:rhomboid protease GluP